MKHLRYAEHNVTVRDALEVVRVLRGRDLASGDTVRKFEQAFEDQLVTNAVAVSSGTAALHLAMLAAGIGEGDVVITTPNSFVASANAAKYVGAQVGFIDIDFATGCINIDKLIEDCKSPSVKAVVVVDFAGIVPDIAKLQKNIRDDIVIIEDASHAVGGVFVHRGMPSGLPLSLRVGSHPWADMTTFSFHASKSMTTGEGGMILTKNARLADKLELLRTHGMKNNELRMIGYNYRMTDIQAALGLSQFRRLPDIQAHRAAILKYYVAALKGLPFIQFVQPDALQDRQTLCWHLACVRINWEAYGTSRKQVQQHLKAHGIGTQVHYFPIPLQPVYGWSMVEMERLWPNALKHWQETLSLPLHTKMGIGDAERVITELRKAIIV